MKPKLILSFAILVLSLAALACVTSPESLSITATLSATQPPLSEPAPTQPASDSPTPVGPEAATVAASATPTLEPTAIISNPTPEVTLPPPTPDPNLNLGSDLYADTFDGKSGWFWTFSDDIASFEAKEGELKIETKQGNNSWRYVLRDDVTAGDQQVRLLTKTTACPGNDEYGFMYRGAYTPDQILQTYILKLNCAGQARVELLAGATVKVLKDWETFPAIQPGAPTENTLMIWMLKDQFHFYVNDQFLFSLTEATLAEGFFGFYVQGHSSGGGSLTFDDFSVREVTAP